MFADQPVSVQCVICRRSNSRRVCGACLGRTDDDLESIPRLYESLGEAMEPSWGIRAEGRVSGGGRTGSPPPLRLEPLSLRAHGGIVSVLRFWEADWRAVLGWTAAPFRGSVEQTVAGCVKFLRSNWPWCADDHPQPEEFAANIREWTAACRLQVYGPGDARLIGVCPTVAEDGVVCGTSLWANPFAEKIECRGCKSTWSRTEWLLLGRRMRASSYADSLDSANTAP